MNQYVPQFYQLIIHFVEKCNLSIQYLISFIEKSITVRQLMLIFQSFVNGYCRVTGQQPPEYSLLEKYSRQYFLRGNPGSINKTIKLRRLIDQIEGSVQVTQLFNRFQQTQYINIKQDYILYSEQEFKQYSIDEVEKMYRIIMKVYRDKDYQEVELVQYNRQLRLGNRRYADFKDQINTQRKGSKIDLSPIKKSKLKSRNISLSTLPTMKQNKTINPQLTKFNTINKELSSHKKFQPPAKCKFLFLNGQTVSKRQLFQTISYFRALSNNQQNIRAKQFFRSFEKKSFMKKQLSSLFRVIDVNKNGQISFDQFLKAFYPNIKQHEIKTILKWQQDYFRIYYADSLQQNQLKVNNRQNFHILPKDSLKRIQEIFNTIDLNKKGYIDFDDLSRAFKVGFTIREIQNIIKQYGGDKGRIDIHSLIKLLLPRGWMIDGYHKIPVLNVENQ